MDLFSRAQACAQQKVSETHPALSNPIELQAFVDQALRNSRAIRDCYQGLPNGEELVRAKLLELEGAGQERLQSSPYFSCLDEAARVLWAERLQKAIDVPEAPSDWWKYLVGGGIGASLVGGFAYFVNIVGTIVNPGAGFILQINPFNEAPPLA